MKLIVNRVGLQGMPTEANLEHTGCETLVFNIALFDKMSYSSDNFDIFEQINGYWARLSIIKQDAIYDVYRRIKDTFYMTQDSNELTKALYVLIAELYTYHELADVRHWVDYHSGLSTPIVFNDVYKESHETPGTRERTYLKEDYKWLVTLSIALRVMIPIWGEFIRLTKETTGTVFKEYYAYKLLAYSSIAKSEPMERLRVYVEHSLPAEKSKSAAILGGISSDDFPTWILSLVLVRRLSVGDVRGIDQTSHLVTFIYKYIGAKVKGHDNSFIGMVKDKFFEGQGQEGENNLSKLEGYKNKQDIPAGDPAIIEFYVNNTVNLAFTICPDIDIELLHLSEKSVQVLSNSQIWPAQVKLMQLVLKKAIPPRGLQHLNKSLMLKTMAVAQALLWHKGHFELAALISAQEQSNIDELQLTGTDSRARISKEQLEVLDTLYPYIRMPTGKQKVPKRTNAAEDAINSMESLFSEHAWRLTLPEDWVMQLTGNKHNRNYPVPHNAKPLLCKLVISLAQRTF